MAVKILIKRAVPDEKSKELSMLLRQLRMLTMSREGYISGETLRNLDDPEEFIVISNWQSSNDWSRWLKSAERQEIQGRIDTLLGGHTHYALYHYGFTE